MHASSSSTSEDSFLPLFPPLTSALSFCDRAISECHFCFFSSFSAFRTRILIKSRPRMPRALQLLGAPFRIFMQGFSTSADVRAWFSSEFSLSYKDSLAKCPTRNSCFPKIYILVQGFSRKALMLEIRHFSYLSVSLIS